jgi:CBS domain-containing protein
MMPKAKDFMTKDVISVKRDTPILEALELMAEKNITGIPVVNDDTALEGILTERDVLRLYHASKDKKWKVVEDFMTQPAIYFDEDEDLDEVCDCLMNNYFRRVPVTSKGKLVGIISRRDIIVYILQPMHQNTDAHQPDKLATTE